MHSMHDGPPSVNRPETGLALLPRKQLPALRERYLELLRTPHASPAAVYLRAVLAQIDSQLQQNEAA